MTDDRLSSLYRRLCAMRSGTMADERGVSGADGDALARVLAGAPAGTAIASMLADLRPASEALAAEVARAVGGRLPHRSRAPMPSARHAPPHRRHVALRRWSAIAASCLVALAGLWGWRHTAHEATPVAAIAPAPGHQAVAMRGDLIFTTRDTIFGGGMDRNHGRDSRDQVFRGEFGGI
jgi:hypothetical protein